jgi:hypothetical protein
MAVAEPSTTTIGDGRLRTGGIDGNERLTTITGFVLLLLFAVLGITILFIGRLLWLHLFLGIVLFGPVALKISSTAYRFVRYYTNAPAYRHKGPPHLFLRALGPMVLLTTVGVFLSGLLLVLVGPDAGSRPALGLLHKVTFILWLVAMAPHVLGHLVELPRNLLRSDRDYRRLPGTSARWLALLVALVGGLVLAVLLLPDFSVWTSFHYHGVDR